MTPDVEFLTTDDKPALIALGSLHFLELVKRTLSALVYKTHTALNHGDFFARFTRIQYQLVVLDDDFDTQLNEPNLTLQNLQVMAVNQRRHAVILLLGDRYTTLDPMQAFANSVHAVLNFRDITKLPQIIQQVVSENDLFLHTFRETSLRVARGRS